MYILFGGRKQVGKTTSAKICEDLIFCGSRHTAEIRPFAHALKEDVERIFGIPFDKLDGTDAQKNEESRIKWTDFNWAYWNERKRIGVDPVGFMTNRQIMQYYGGMMREEINKNIWVDRVINNDDHNIKFSASHYIIIPDGRFLNELEACFKYQGLSILIRRNTGLQDNHESEKVEDYIDMFKYVIDNNGSLNELRSKIYDILNSEGIL